MLKVLINEEEVLTNKDFTIKKEMLNTPSVILNNVYPKTWEDTKDYTSNFYHPQDYSKCKIIDETIIPAEPGETISGTSFTIANNDNTKINELTEIEGNTTQSGTPTPDSPQPINVVSGRQEVDIVGKNFLVPFNASNVGVDVSTEGYTMTINGTSTGSSNFAWSSNFYLKAGTYRLNTKYVSGSIDNNIQLIFRKYNSDDNLLGFTIGTSNYQNNRNEIFVLDEDTYVKYTAYIGGSNRTYDNYKFNIQLTTSTSADYDFEAYKGQSYEINLGKNLLVNNLTGLKANNTSGTWNDNVYSINGTTFTCNSDGSITVDGAPSSNTNFYINRTGTSSFQSSYLEAGTYYITTHETTGSNSTWKMQISLDGTITNIFGTGNNKEPSRTITTGINISYAMLIIYSGQNPNGATFYPMICKTQGTVYAPYKTPIELCKINTYKDRIYKENGTWYLHKEIVKVVLNGSENWTRLNASGSNKYRFRTNVSDIQQNVSSVGFSNYFTNNGDSWSNNGISGGGDSNIYIRYPDLFTQISDLTTWLSTHNTIVYYVLATPITTEITDTELISQLNAIELLEGLNNVSVSSAYLPGEITIHYNYTEEQTIDDLLFCGVVKNSGNISLNPREPHYSSLQILDFKTFLSEGELDSFVIYQKTITEAIQMVIANIQDYGFILGNVNILNPTDIIGAYSTKDKTAYDVFNYLADITQSRWTTRLIDENHVAIDFYDPTLMIEGTPINYTQTFFEDNLIDDMTYSYGSNNYRNKQVMTSSQVYSNISQQQSIVANGYQTQFPTEQPIGKINSITSNGIPLTFATFNEKDMGYVADFYYSPGDNYFESEDLRSTGEILIIDYVAIVEGRQIITNPLEIDRINESTGRKGIISRYEQRNDATTSTELQKIGESYIKYKGTPEIKLKIKTRSNIWEVGQRVQFNAPIEELDTEYMVRTKKINYISTIDTIFYEYELISSFNSETEINYFDNQRAKASGNIGEGEYISRNIDIESTANIIFYDTETTEVQVDGDNELNAILNSPFTS